MNKKNCDHFFDVLLENGLVDCVHLTLERGGETVYHYCKTNHSKKAYSCLREDTSFNIGSVTKIFTGSLVMKLMELGLIAVNDKVRQYVPEYPFDDVAIYDLLNHTAGYTEKDTFPKWPQKLDEQRKYLNEIYAIKTRENKVREYSNYWSFGYSVLMDIIQRITSQSIEEMARKYIFDPLNMNNTTYDVRKIDLNNVIWPKDAVSGELQDFSQTPPIGDSGLLSNPLDLQKYGRALLDIFQTRRHGIFSSATVDYMFSDDTGGKFNRTPVFWIKDPVCECRGLGTISSAQTIAHTGFSGCILLLDPKFDIVLAMTTNSIKMHLDSTNYDRIINLLWHEAI